MRHAPHAPTSGARLAELVAALSIGTDLGLGAPMEHALRQCLLALGLGERLGLDDSERAVVYFVALLAWVGCHADSYEQARWFGADLPGTRMAWFVMSHLGNGSPALRRTGTALQFLTSGREQAGRMTETHCL